MRRMRPAPPPGAAETDVQALARAGVDRRDRHRSLAYDRPEHAGVPRASAEAIGHRRNRRGADLAVRLYESSKRRSCVPACARSVGLGAGWQRPLDSLCRGACGRRAAGAARCRRHPARRRARCAWSISQADQAERAARSAPPPRGRRAARAPPSCTKKRAGHLAWLEADAPLTCAGCAPRDARHDAGARAAKLLPRPRAGLLLPHACGCVLVATQRCAACAAALSASVRWQRLCSRWT